MKNYSHEDVDVFELTTWRLMSYHVCIQFSLNSTPFVCSVSFEIIAGIDENPLWFDLFLYN